MELPYLYLTTTSNKEFTDKSSLTSFCAESSEKKLGWSAIFHELKSVVNDSLRMIRRFLKEELTSNQLKIPIMNWLFESEPVCRLCNL